jgi:hypothetical protein
MHDKLQSAKDLFEFEAIRYGWLILVIMFSATARYFKDLPDEDDVTARGLFKAFMTSGFFGMAVAFLCFHYKVEMYYALFAVCMSTFNGRLLYEVGAKGMKEIIIKK